MFLPLVLLTLRPRAEVTLVWHWGMMISYRRSTTRVSVLRLARSTVLRLGGVSHRGLQKGFIIATSLDKLLVELSEFIWRV